MTPRAQGRPAVRRTMAWVLLALLPGTAMKTWLFGAGVLWQILLATAFALACEAAVLRLRGRAWRPALLDLSAPLSGVLFALCLPPLAPWWVAATGTLAAIGLAKHAFGGLGSNLFNPAMVGYAVVLVCFPLELTRWSAPGGAAPGALDALRTILTGALPPALDWDAIAQATPLDVHRSLAAAGLSLGEVVQDPRFGAARPDAWAWLALGWAAGGALLLWRGAIRWQVPGAMLGAAVLATLPFWLFDPDLHASPLAQLTRGSLVFAACFIATDPVTGCTTPRGRLCFGAGVALLALALRHAGAQVDGVAFAVLAMNAAAPWLDLRTRPRFRGQAHAA